MWIVEVGLIYFTQKTAYEMRNSEWSSDVCCSDLPHPESVPINNLVKVPGTPLAGTPDIDPFEFVRTIAVARIAMPGAVVRLSAGREAMSDELQALCFMAGAHSIFYCDRLITTGNPPAAQDRLPFE